MWKLNRETLSFLENQLDGSYASERRTALETLAQAVKSGDIRLPEPKDEVNLHFHTFFSFNSENWSPSRIAWESVKYGLKVSGIVDFDVLDGMEEFLAAGELLGLKTVVGMETRVFIKELADKVICSPNEPGVAYFMASGCYKLPEHGSESADILASMRTMAKDRNLAMIARVNEYLGEVQIDYTTDVTPLTPSGNATERHLLLAYDRKAQTVFGGDAEKIASFWSVKLGISKDDASQLLQDTPKFHEKLRAKLMKCGGVGYVAPDSNTFPSIEDAVKMIRGMGAIPMAAWLDGTNPGEEDHNALLELLRSKGVDAVNIIPDRNWRISNPDEKTLKVRKLGEFIAAARKQNMPIAVGTEMNKIGLPFVDDFESAELKPYVGDFVADAELLYGHTVLASTLDFGYASDRSIRAFGEDSCARNAFYTSIGRNLSAPWK